MQIQSTRFGSIDIAEDAVIEFADGIIGLPGTRYALVAQQEGSSFYWLHSVDDPSVALPVTQPWLFFPSYDVAVSDEDSAKLGLDAARAGRRLLRRPRRPGARGLHGQPARAASWSTPPAGSAGR